MAGALGGGLPGGGGRDGRGRNAPLGALSADLLGGGVGLRDDRRPVRANDPAGGGPGGGGARDDGGAELDPGADPDARAAGGADRRLGPDVRAGTGGGDGVPDAAGAGADRDPAPGLSDDTGGPLHRAGRIPTGAGDDFGPIVVPGRIGARHRLVRADVGGDTETTEGGWLMAGRGKGAIVVELEPRERAALVQRVELANGQVVGRRLDLAAYVRLLIREDLRNAILPEIDGEVA